MVAFYLTDLGLEDGGSQMVETALLSSEFKEELQGMSQALGIELESLLLANLYYDAIKSVIGCTGFAVETQDGPLHARNLDWWGEEDILSKNTVVFDFCRNGRTVYQVVGWPGFAGAFSGIAPGRFAVTLNAVSSNEPSRAAPSVTFLIRETLEKAQDFDKAVSVLQHTALPCDCLLLLTGPKAGQRVVIERTPTTAAVRHPENEMLVVANSYQALEQTETAANLLSQTSCGRSERVKRLIALERPQTVEECFRILGDPQVEMSITAQSMVFGASTGLREVRTHKREVSSTMQP